MVSHSDFFVFQLNLTIPKAFYWFFGSNHWPATGLGGDKPARVGEWQTTDLDGLKTDRREDGETATDIDALAR